MVKGNFLTEQKKAPHSTELLAEKKNTEIIISLLSIKSNQNADK